MKVIEFDKKRKEAEPRCPWCGSATVHLDFSCPRISAVDFGEDWEPVRVEFHEFYSDSSSPTIEEPQETEQSQS